MKVTPIRNQSQGICTKRNRWKRQWPWPPLAGINWVLKADVKCLFYSFLCQVQYNRPGVVNRSGLCIQYLFLFVIVLIISARFPKILKENLGGGILVQKIIGTLLVSLGLYMLVWVIAKKLNFQTGSLASDDK